MCARAHMSLVKAFEASRVAAAALGPKAGMPSASSASTSPNTSGASGPTTTKSIRSRRQNPTSPLMSVAAIATHSASSAMPALPGAQNRLSTSGEADIAQASACSRPPEPTTSTRIALPPVLRYHVGMDETLIAAPLRSNLAEYTVSELSRALKRSIEENFAYVRVRGEISGYKRHSSGHCYLVLKDSDAVLDAVCWRITAMRLGIKPEDGMEVVCTGRLTTFPDRFPRRVLLWPVAVQGEGAAAQVAAAIEGFNRLPEGAPGRGAVPRPQLIIVARGGGSLEDLMPFNEEIVVRAAAASAIPLISAVGHETDTTLIDHASDRRAPTPTAAAEMAVPVRIDLLAELGAKAGRLTGGLARLFADRREWLAGLSRGLPKPAQLLQTAAQRLDDWSERLTAALPALLTRKQ